MLSTNPGEKSNLVAAPSAIQQQLSSNQGANVGGIQIKPETSMPGLSPASSTPTTASSLIKSLLANKVTTTQETINTTASVNLVVTTNASNVHQVTHKPY